LKKKEIAAEGEGESLPRPSQKEELTGNLKKGGDNHRDYSITGRSRRRGGKNVHRVLTRSQEKRGIVRRE